MGLKEAVNIVSLPGASVWGVESPDALNPVPDTDIFVIVRSVVPVFPKRMVCVSVVPTVTFPKLTDDGVASMPGPPPVAATPIPSSLTDRGVASAVVVINKFPCASPACMGAKRTEKSKVDPALTALFTERFPPPVLYPGPANCIFDTVRAVVPVFVRVSERELLVWTGTFPKFTEDGVTMAVVDAPPPPGPPVTAFPVTPTHAEVASAPMITRASENR